MKRAKFITQGSFTTRNVPMLSHPSPPIIPDLPPSHRPHVTPKLSPRSSSITTLPARRPAVPPANPRPRATANSSIEAQLRFSARCLVHTLPSMTGRHKPMRLPPLQTLRVHNPKRSVENPCIAIMSSVLGTWLPFVCMSRSFATDRNQHVGPQQATTQPAAPPSRTNYAPAWTARHHLPCLRTRSTTT